MDDFERRARDGLGDADQGGTYVLEGDSAQTEVVAGRATVRLSADALGRGLLDATGGRELEATVELSLDRPAREGEVTGAMVLRAGQDVAYRPGVAFIRDTVGVVVDVVAGGVARRIAGPVEIPGVDIGTDTVMLRAEVSGSDPATINVSAWAASQQRPADWMVSVVDWTGQLQRDGAIGLAWQRIGGEGRAPLVLTFDQLVISTRDPVAGQ